MKKNTGLRMRLFVGLSLLAFVSAPPAWGRGVFGGGNTGDELIEWQFVKTSAIAFVRAVSAEDFRNAGASTEAQRIYSGCRETILRGLIQTQFRFVERIADGGQYHALARRRAGGVVEVSRTKIQELLAARALVSATMVGSLIHEATHDCRLNGQPISDRFDAFLNEIGEGVIRASGGQALAGFADLAFVDRAARGTALRFDELSGATQRALTERFQEYLADWVFLRFRQSFAGIERPQSGAKFFESQNTQVFPGWESLNWRAVSAQAEPQALITKVVRASVGALRPRFLNAQGQSDLLPLALNCTRGAGANATPAAACRAAIDLAPAPVGQLARGRVVLEFTLDVFGKLEVTRVSTEGL